MRSSAHILNAACKQQNKLKSALFDSRFAKACNTKPCSASKTSAATMRQIDPLKNLPLHSLRRQCCRLHSRLHRRGRFYESEKLIKRISSATMKCVRKVRQKSASETLRSQAMIAWLTAPKAICLSYCFCPVTAKSCKIFGLRGLRIRKTAFMGRVQAMLHAALHTQAWSLSVCSHTAPRDCAFRGSVSGIGYTQCVCLETHCVYTLA